MHGNIDYKNEKKRYGGIVKKLQKVCFNQSKIKNILEEMSKSSTLSDESPTNLLFDI
jgi:hypothetical protein